MQDNGSTIAVNSVEEQPVYFTTENTICFHRYRHHPPSYDILEILPIFVFLKKISRLQFLQVL